MNRRGFVLWTMLAALLLVGAVEAAAIFEALQEHRAAENAEAALMAQSAAASGIAAVASSGAPAAMALMDIGDSALVATALMTGGDYSVVARRVGARLYRAASIGRDHRLGLERSAVTVLRMSPLLPAGPPAALVVRSPPDSSIVAQISGSDTGVAGWHCPTLSAGGVAVRVVPGAPDSTFFALGPMRWQTLRDWASVTGRSLDSLQVQFSAGDLVLDGTRSLGSVVVDGALTLRSGASVTGLAVATGTLVFGPGGGSILGGAIADNVQLAGASPAQVRIGYSECARRVAGGLWAPLEPVPGLPWVGFR
jgi:hypothetical protein